MPPTIGGVTIDPQGQTLTVTVTPSAKVYTDAAGSTLASFPASVTTRTSYWMSSAQQFTISVKTPQGVEIADGAGSPLVLDIQQGTNEGIAPVVDRPGPEDQAQSGTYAVVANGAINLLDYGGTLADFTTAAAAAIAQKRPLYVPGRGTAYPWTVFDTAVPRYIDVTDDLVLLGDGDGKTILNIGPATSLSNDPSGDTGLFHVAAGKNVRCENMTLHGPSVDTSATAATTAFEHVGGAGQLSFRNVTIDGFSRAVAAQWPTTTVDSRVDDPCTVAAGSNIVLDASITAPDAGGNVQGLPFPAGALVGVVTPGVSFTVVDGGAAPVNALMSGTYPLAIGGSAWSTLTAADLFFEGVCNISANGGGAAIAAQGAGKFTVRGRLYIPTFGKAASTQAHALYIHTGRGVDMDDLVIGTCLGTSYGVHFFHASGVPNICRIRSFTVEAGAYRGVLTNQFATGQRRMEISDFDSQAKDATIRVQGDCDIFDGRISGATSGGHITSFTGKVARIDRVRHSGLGGANSIKALIASHTGTDWTVTGCSYDQPSDQCFTVSAGSVVFKQGNRWSDSVWTDGIPGTMPLGVGYQWLGDSTSVSTSATLVNGTERLIPVVIPRRTTVSRLQVEVTAGGDAPTAVTDGVITGTTNLQSTLTTFTAAWVGRLVYGNANVPAGTIISAFVDAHNVTLSQPCTNGSGLALSVSGAVIRIGIRKDDGTGYPGAVLLDAGLSGSGGLGGSGLIDGSVIAAPEITVSQLLEPGTYFFGATVQGVVTTQPTVRIYNNINVVGISQAAALAANSTAVGYSQPGQTGALGAFSATKAPTANVPRIGAKLS